MLGLESPGCMESRWLQSLEIGWLDLALVPQNIEEIVDPAKTKRDLSVCGVARN